MKNIISKVCVVFLSCFLFLGVFTPSLSAHALDNISTYAYEDIPLEGTAEFIMGEVIITAYVRYNYTTQRYTFLRYTYDVDFDTDEFIFSEVTSVKCDNYSGGDEITGPIRFTINAISIPGMNWKKTVTINI